MTLELAILDEQKVARIIHLPEDVRRDAPKARDRIAPEAAATVTATGAPTAASATRP